MISFPGPNKEQYRRMTRGGEILYWCFVVACYGVFCGSHCVEIHRVVESSFAGAPSIVDFSLSVTIKKIH